MRRIWPEALVVALTAWAVYMGVQAGADGIAAQAAHRSGEILRDAARLRAEALSAWWSWLLGVLALLAGRAVSLRGSGHVAAPLIVPTVAVMTGLGLVALVGYGDPLHEVVFRRGDGTLLVVPGMGRDWPAPGFASGVLIGSVAAALVMAARGLRPDVWLERRRVWVVIGAVVVAIFAALAVAGRGPGGTRINLGFFQPIELVKLAFVALTAGVLGTQAANLRHERRRFLKMTLPRHELLLPALLTLLLIFGGLFVVGDLGPSLVLGFAFLVLYQVTTRSVAEVVILAGAALAGLAVLFFVPGLLPKYVVNRLSMMTDPWLNGLPGGDQLGRSLWAVASGGFSGQGPGGALIGGVPAGHTDFALSHLAETLGFLGVAAYVVAFGLLVLQGFWIGAHNRTPVRSLLATGVSALLFAQWAVITLGGFGVIPLTGIVVPFLSSGRTSMVVMMAAVGLLGLMATEGRPRAETDELLQLRRGTLGVMLLAAAVIAAVLVLAFRGGVAAADATSLRPLVTKLGDGTLRVHHDPRLVALARKVPRGRILDRNGELLAGAVNGVARVYPLGSSLGTLLGWVDPGNQSWRPRWALENALDGDLTTVTSLEDGPAQWVAASAHGERHLRIVPSRAPTAGDEAWVAKELREGERARLRPIPGARDYSELLPLLRAGGGERVRVIAALRDDDATRTVRLTLDARLQRRVAAILRDALHRSPSARAAAAVVIDVDTGHILARAQAPDFDPGSPDLPRLRADPNFNGVYGPNADKTGDRGIYQAGSVAKLVTALAAIREGVPRKGRGRQATSADSLRCLSTDGRAGFKSAEWNKPIRDAGTGPAHGPIDLARALEVSCNAYFAQLALALGPAPLRALVEDGLAIGFPGVYDPGAPGSRELASTGIGQGQAAWSVTQAARAVAAIAAGGVYRTCDVHMRLDRPCVETRLVEDEEALEPILAGMRRVVVGQSGTGRNVRRPPGLRVYGKSGTAEDPVRAEERPYHTRKASHAWFAAFAEREAGPECIPERPGRLAVAVVLPRGGWGSKVAGPVAIEILEAAKELGFFPAAAD